MKILESFAQGVIANRQPATASIADALRDAILKGVLKGGEPLRQDAVAKQFAVSQVTVREALRILEHEGLVSVTPRRGAVVYSLSPEDVAEITDLRATLEGSLIKAAMSSLNAQDFEMAEATIKQLEQARDIDDLISLNVVFHKCLYGKANRPRTTAILDRLRASLEPYLRLLWNKTGYKRESQDDHRKILVLCREKNVAEVEKFLRIHIEKTGREIEDLLKNLVKND
ncbi:GntR family transcriptional regulator [Glaciimonas sp. Gout2]|uniref:GntR family transcriptional regulator n=1 Tax=unclassified Glaciimonas TaxID=2644401 RepID=UPI002B222D74|nr:MULTISPECIES: GntR family transcriptional regulator [unclassified Glaciimonas]MEB0011321.1 GntR family transcriptional regulator [Glaciimonas sp. Cout2]MEB0080971.1 GntR family transcriptional regulator [Glaciimonas sp. Gout2]